MRASKMAAEGKQNREMHISGAEGIYSVSEISRAVKRYTERALEHPRGSADNIVITIEKISEKIAKIPCLQLATLECISPYEAKKIIIKKLAELGISPKALNTAFKILESSKAMRGASLVLMQSGKRAEPDKQRGVRVSRLGIKGPDKALLKKRLSKIKINTETVREALVLASKIASAPDIIAEVCISDDPDYTTGYIASGTTGYLRIPNIKKQGSLNGGRVFFVKENSDTGKIIDYLERKPVMITVKRQGNGKHF